MQEVHLFLTVLLWEIEKEMKIYLPHINYTVTVKQLKNPPEELLHCQAYAESIDKNNCIVYLDLKKKINAGDLAHELVHVLQFICLNRNINFTLEQEHMAYIMHYLMGKILGYTWV